MTVAIIKYNAGNTASVTNALLRMNVTPVITDDAAEIRAASHVIFPGVGHAQPAMAYLRERGLDQVIRGLTQPFLGICLGLQLLCDSSEEGDTTSIGIFSHKVRRFASGPKVPHMGWNTVSLEGSGLEPWRHGHAGSRVTNAFFKSLERYKLYCSLQRWRWRNKTVQHFYFLHAYRADLGVHTAAACDYGGAFSAIMRKDNFLAVQFHPEKSGKAGAALLEKFIAS